MRRLKVVLMVVLAALCVVFFGCKQGRDVVGKWKNVNIPETIEFKKDMSGVFTVQNNPSLPFRWKNAGDGKIELDINFKGTVRTLYGKVDKNTFVLSGNGEQAVYNRVE